MPDPTIFPGVFRFTHSYPQLPEEIMVAWTEPMMKWEVWFHYVPREGDCCYHCECPPLEVNVDILLEPEGDGCWRLRGVGSDSESHWHNKDLGLLTGVPVPAPWLSTPVQSEDVVPNGH